MAITEKNFWAFSIKEIPTILSKTSFIRFFANRALSSKLIWRILDASSGHEQAAQIKVFTLFAMEFPAVCNWTSGTS